MVSGYDSDTDPVVERWNRVLEHLSARPRRDVIVALADAPPDRHLSLPDAVLPADVSVPPRQYAIELQHNHLPRLAEAGYVEWSSNPLSVARGPRFEEPRSVLSVLRSSSDQLPSSLLGDVVGGEHDGT